MVMTESATGENDVQARKQLIRQFIDTVWRGGDLDALGQFWTADCVNHAAPPGQDTGLAALRAYHESFAAQFAAFSDVRIEIVQQIGEADRTVTHLLTHARHTGDFGGISATGRPVVMATIRIDRFDGQRITEHWSVADLAGVLAQLHSGSSADAG